MDDLLGIEFPVRGFITNSQGHILSTESLDQGILIRWGFEIVSVQNNWTQRVVLPPNWKIVGSGYHHYVLDEHGRTRASYFEKNTGWENALFGRCCKRFRATAIPVHGMWVDRTASFVPAILDGGIPIWIGKRVKNASYSKLELLAEEQLCKNGWNKLSLVEQWELPTIPFLKVTPAVERYFGVRINFYAKALKQVLQRLHNLKVKYYWLPDSDEIDVYQMNCPHQPMLVYQSLTSTEKTIVSSKIISEANAKRVIASYERRREMATNEIEQLRAVKERLLKGRLKAGECFGNLDYQD